LLHFVAQRENILFVAALRNTFNESTYLVIDVIDIVELGLVSIFAHIFRLICLTSLFLKEMSLLGSIHSLFAF
jgi:hypothetical protein